MSSKYISNVELTRFNKFYRPINGFAPDYYILSELPSISEIFRNPEVFYSFIFIEDPVKEVGHWCLLTKVDENNFEWFDCLALPIPDILASRIDDHSQLINTPIHMSALNIPLMNEKNWICGKWCMFRVMTLPSTLKEFCDNLVKLSTVMTPDSLVDFVVNFKI